MLQLNRMKFFLIILFCMHAETHATIFGSDTNVQAAQAFFTFPNGQSNNRLATYGFASNGFALASATTSAVFDSIFPVAGTIQLNGGTLTLNRDLIFNNVTTLQGLGTIIGQNHRFSLSPNTTTLPNAKSFQDTVLSLNNDVTVSSTITFTGLCTIEGNGHQLNLLGNGAIQVVGTLLMHNVILNGISGTKVQCLDDGSLLILDNCTWVQTANTTFALGALQFRNDVLFTGTNTFSYQTAKTSLVAAQATLLLDAGFTFRYDPIKIPSKTLLQFSDVTSALALNSATFHVTTTGINLTRGSLIIKGDSAFESEIKQSGSTTILDQGITLGDGLSSLSDFSTTLLTGARLRVPQGSLNYKNLLSSSWTMENSVSLLNMGDNTTLRLYKTLDLQTGSALLNNNVTLARVPTAQLVGSAAAVGNLFFASL